MTNFFIVLNQLTISDLKKRFPLLQKKNKKPTRKIGFIYYIYDDMTKNHRLYWNKLSSIEKKAVAEVIYQTPDENGGLSFNAYYFKSKYNRLPKYFTRHDYYGFIGDKKKEKMSYLMLFFYQKNLPSTLAPLMKQYVEKPESASITIVTEDKLPKTIHHKLKSHHKKRAESIHAPKVKILYTEEMVNHEINALLRLIETGQCTLCKRTLHATHETLQKIDQLLLAGDYYLPEDDWGLAKYEGSPICPIRTFAWPRLLQASGFVKRVGTKLHLTVEGKKALNAPLNETVSILYQHWRNKKIIDEFSRIDTIKGQTGRIMTAVSERRKVIESVLQQCPVDQWIAVDSLFRYMKVNGSGLRVCQQEWKLYIGNCDYGNLGIGENFEMLEGRYILVYLFEYLATMGLIDIAYTVPYLVRDDCDHLWGTEDLAHLSRYDGLLYFRINPLGAYCLGLTQQYQYQPPTIIKKPTLVDLGEARLLRCHDKAFAKMLASHPATKKYCTYADSLGLTLVIPDKTKKQFAKGLENLGYIYPQEKP